MKNLENLIFGPFSRVFITYPVDAIGETLTLST